MKETLISTVLSRKRYLSFYKLIIWISETKIFFDRCQKNNLIAYSLTRNDHTTNTIRAFIYYKKTLASCALNLSALSALIECIIFENSLQNSLGYFVIVTRSDSRIITECKTV